MFANTDDDEFFTSYVSLSKNIDPWEKFNRKVFNNFVVKVYDNVVVPFGDWYTREIPFIVRQSLQNVSQNFLYTPKDAIFSVLDFSSEAVVVSFWRFVINSSIGFFGFVDIANDVGLKTYDKNIGHILYFYHIDRGPYLVLPLGPGNLRDLTGSIIFMSITSPFLWRYVIHIDNIPLLLNYYYRANILYIPFHTKYSVLWILYFTNIFNIPNLFGINAVKIKFLSESVVDRYVSFRTAYFQNLAADEQRYDRLRKNGNLEKTNICDFDGTIEYPEECYEDPKTYNISNRTNV